MPWTFLQQFLHVQWVLLRHMLTIITNGIIIPLSRGPLTCRTSSTTCSPKAPPWLWLCLCLKLSCIRLNTRCLKTSTLIVTGIARIMVTTWLRHLKRQQLLQLAPLLLLHPIECISNSLSSNNSSKPQLSTSTSGTCQQRLQLVMSLMSSSADSEPTKHTNTESLPTLTRLYLSEWAEPSGNWMLTLKRD